MRVLRAPLAAGLAVTLVVLAGCRMPWADEESAGSIELSGTVEARQVDLAFQVRGRIAELAVDEGGQLETGELAARLDSRDYRAALARAEAEAEAARNHLARLEAGSRTQEIRAAEARLAEARAERTFARAEVQRVEGLIGRDLASREELDRARRNRDVAQARVAAAEESLALLREGPRKEEIAQARAELEARQAAVDAASLDLQHTRLESPVPGTVTTRLAEAGEVVAPGQPVLRVADLTRPWVRAYLPEPDLARVRPGQTADVRVDGLPGHVFEGTLSFIAPEAEFTPKTVETRALRVDLVYRVKVRVEDPEGRLKVGMPADVRVSPAKSP